MTKHYRHVSAYLDDARFAAVSQLAKDRGLAISTLMKWLIEQELDGPKKREDKILDNQVRLLIGVDALLKHHSNEKLLGIVRDTRKARLEGASDEA